jgi:hypothetical protein
MKLGLELLFTLSFFISFYTLGRKNLYYILISAIVYTFFADYIFYKAGYKIGEISIGKLFIDINFLILFSFFILQQSFGREKIGKFNFLFFLCLLFSLFLLIYGATVNGIVAAVNGWRSIFLFIFMGWLIALFTKRPIDLLRAAIVTIIIVCFINSIYSIYEYFTFDGNFTENWRYDLLLEAKLSNNADFKSHFMEYQLTRGSELRSSGFFASALASGYFTALASILVTNRIINYRLDLSSICYVIILFLFLVSMYVSQVRTAFIIYFLTLLFAYLLSSYRIKKIFFVIYVLCIPFLILFTGLIFVNYLDPSSLSRIMQYQSLATNFSLLGAGLGGHVGKFDSFYIYSIVDLGVFSILLLLLFIKYFEFLPISKSNFLSLETKKIPIIQSTYLTVFPVFAVQHVASSLYYLLIIMLISLISREYKNT